MQENKATAKPLNQAIEIHDSVLGSIEVVDRTVTLNLAPAYIHRSLGEPGADQSWKRLDAERNCCDRRRNRRGEHTEPAR